MKKYKKIYIEITNRCNLSCRFCLESKRPKRFMPPDEFETILRKIDGFTNHLCLHVLGEPLLHPDFPGILDICRRYGLRVNLSTNGTLLAQHRAALLTHPALRQINFSVHSLAETASSANREALLTAILHFTRAARSTPLYICLRLWNAATPATEGISSPNDRILEQIQTVFGIPEPIRNVPTLGNGIALAPRVFLSLASPFSWPHLPGPDRGERGTCRGLRDHIAILVDGTVVPCCLDAEADIPLGNIHRQSLSQMMTSPRAEALRRGFSAQKIVEPLCRRCSFRQRFLPDPAHGVLPPPGEKRTRI